MSMAASQPVSNRSPGLGPVVVMGVSGCGKSSVGEGIARQMGCLFVEGDSLHSPENVRKMNSGIALDDSDRWPWLQEVGSKLASSDDIVVSCSALKRAYRDQLRMAAGRAMTFIFLEGTRALLGERMAARTNHYMPPSLLDSQLATLEPPGQESDVITIDIDQPVERIIELALSALAARKSALS